MSRIPELTDVEWVKSSYSNTGGGECVEWAPSFPVSGIVPVRDSKHPEGPALLFSTAAWNGFINGIKTGEFPTV